MRIRPKKPPCISCYGDGPEIDGLQLFGRGEAHPCAWVHYRCLDDYLTRHTAEASDGGLRLSKVCIICDVNVRTVDLRALHVDPSHEKACAWVHLECAADYG